MNKYIYILIGVIFLLFYLGIRSFTDYGEMRLNEKEKTITIEKAEFYQGSLMFMGDDIECSYDIQIKDGIKEIDLKKPLVFKQTISIPINAKTDRKHFKIINYSIKPNSKYKLIRYRGEQPSEDIAFETDSLNNIREIPLDKY